MNLSLGTIINEMRRLQSQTVMPADPRVRLVDQEGNYFAVTTPNLNLTDGELVVHIGMIHQDDAPPEDDDPSHDDEDNDEGGSELDDVSQENEWIERLNHEIAQEEQAISKLNAQRTTAADRLQRLQVTRATIRSLDQ